MKTCARCFLLISLLIAAGYYLPALYHLLTARRMDSVVVYLGDESRDFLFMRSRQEGKNRTVYYEDEKGRAYEFKDFEQQLPLTFIGQALKEGRMPKVIHGKKVVPQRLRHEFFSIKVQPSLMDSPAVPLYPVFEIDNGRSRLVMPEHFMRLEEGAVELVNARSNAPDREKSEAFSKGLKNAGFVFPARLAASNPNVRKPYDEGIFLVDSLNKVFRLRMRKGEPEILKISSIAGNPETWDALVPCYMQVNETESGEVHVLIVDRKGKLYLAIGDDWRLLEMPLQSYAPAESRFSIRGNLVHRLLVAETGKCLEAVAMDRDYHFLKRYSEPRETREDTKAWKISRIIFPFSWSMEKSSSGFYNFYLTWGSPWALAVNGGLFLLSLICFRWRKQRLPFLAIPGILAGGLYGMLALLFLPPAAIPEKRKP